VGADFRAVLPATFTGLESRQLPENYKPQAHLNYESRTFDWSDSLPKFKAFPGSPMLNNNGEEIAAETKADA
jgi:hypothetical protein